MKPPIWITDTEGIRWIRDFKRPYALSSEGIRRRMSKWFAGTSYKVERQDVWRVWCPSYPSYIPTWFDSEGEQYRLPECYIGEDFTRYIRPLDIFTPFEIMSLEGDMETDEVDALGWVGFAPVEMPVAPPWCGNCYYGDLGNHGDERPFCELLMQEVGYGAIVCPLYKGHK